MSNRNRNTGRNQKLIPFVTTAVNGSMVKAFISPSEASKLPATPFHGEADNKRVNSPSIRFIGNSVLISPTEGVIPGQVISMQMHEYKVLLAGGVKALGPAGLNGVVV